MKDVRIIDSNFGHSLSSCHDRRPKYFNWDRRLYESDICFYTDKSMPLAQSDSAKVKIAWLLEPRAIYYDGYNFIKDNYHLFDFVFTYDLDLLKLDSRFLFYPHSGCWISDSDIKVYDKTKLCSIIASGKSHTIGHKLRHEVINLFSDRMDVLGRGYKTIGNKIEGLKDYRYTIVIENSKQDDYFSEKSIDSFATGAIPIYYGTDNIHKYFDGVITFNNVDELKFIFDLIGPEHYNINIDNINKNLSKVKEYLVAEDFFYEKYTHLFT